MENNIEDLRHIRSMMERSTRFLSLSGISGVAAGSFAILGALAAQMVIWGKFSITHSLTIDFIIIALIVLFCACTSGLYFSIKKAQKNKSKFWIGPTWQIVKDFAVPMVTGGIFSLILIYNGLGYMVGSATLIFYGLALFSAGDRTYKDIKILGLCEIFLGLLSGVSIGWGLLIWAVGFGLLHIVYGIVIYIKYDAPKKSVN